MSQAPKPARYLVLAAMLFLFFALGMQWLKGGSPGEMPEVLMALVLLNLAFHWEGLIRSVR